MVRSSILVACLACLACMSMACTPTVSITGKQCRDDADCIGTNGEAAHYCQREAEPHVCLPGALGVEPLANRAPLAQLAFIVAPANGTSLQGSLGLFDPDGDDVRVVDVDDTINITGDDGTQKGTLAIGADGSYSVIATAPLLRP